MTPTPSAPQSPAGQASGAALSALAISVLALLSAVAPLATDMYLPGFPIITADLGANAVSMQLTLTSFLFGLALGQLVIGPLSDRFGRRRPLIIGTAVCILSGLLCILAADVNMLILLRFVQGFGGAAGVVLARAIIADRTRDATAAARLFQIMMIIGGLAPVLAPIIGTGIVAIAGWRAIFLVIGLLSVLSLIGVLIAIEESLPPARRIQGGFGALLGNIRQLLGNRRYLGFTLTTGFTFMVLFAYISASPFVFQTVLGLPPVGYALAFGINAVGIALVSAVSARLVGRISPHRLAGIGLVVIGGGSLAVLAAVLAGAGAAVMLPCIFVTVASVGLILGNASALAVAEAPRMAGAASALLGALQFCLGAIASPLAGLMGEHDARPMALTMVAAVLLAAISFVWLARQPGTDSSMVAAE